MNTTSHDQNAHMHAPDGHLRPWDHSWGQAFLVLGVALIVFFIIFRAPIGDAVWLWSNRSTYNHCFLVLPIALYLLWEDRHRFFQEAPNPSVLGLGVMAVFLLLWMIAAAADIAEGEHIALVGILQGLLLAVFGLSIYKRHWLPFTYLWLLVPTGEFLIPVLRDLATIQSEWWLKLANIPVYVENYLLQTPTGNYFIAPGCAGLNFVLSAIALTPVYGMLIFKGWGKRLAAIGIMLIIAVVANAIRIFGIIALAEYTNKRIDIVDDHILYGWGFFAVISHCHGNDRLSLCGCPSPR